MLVGGVMAVFKARLGSGLLRVLFGGLTLAGAMIVGLIGLNLQTYAALSKERLAGQVVLKKTGDVVQAVADVTGIAVAPEQQWVPRVSDKQPPVELHPILGFKVEVSGLEAKVFRAPSMGLFRKTDQGLFKESVAAAGHD
jgi:hypothetical protein